MTSPYVRARTSVRQIPTLLAQHLQATAKRLQHLNATDRNIGGRNMLHAFGHPVATCCDMLRENRTIATCCENQTIVHLQAQHCSTSLDKRLQHHTTSTNVAMWPNRRNKLHPTMLQYVVVGLNVFKIEFN